MKAVLNLDGTKNDYLTNSYKEIGTVLLPPLINPIPEPTKPIIIGTPIPEKNKDEGKFVTPILDDKYPINTAHDGSGNPEIKNDTGGNQIIEHDWRDDVLFSKGKEITEAADSLGYGQRISPQKLPFNSHGQPAYWNGKNYITPDVDEHNTTGGWKMFDRRGNRVGTYDKDLNRIKD